MSSSSQVNGPCKVPSGFNVPDDTESLDKCGQTCKNACEKEMPGSSAKIGPRNTSKGKTASSNINTIPADILENSLLNEAISMLPSNYNFEVHKCVWQLKRYRAHRVALQFPEGLLMYSLMIASILERFADVTAVIMGDVTYGACCVDDFTAAAMSCDFMIHYGHSCLIPIDTTKIRVLYVFVEIKLNLERAIHRICDYFHGEVSHGNGKGSHGNGKGSHGNGKGSIGNGKGSIGNGKDLDAADKAKMEHLSSEERNVYKLALVGTIQFVGSLMSVKQRLQEKLGQGIQVTIPQSKPLSPGEILGCTAPKLADDQYQALLYIGDGRFHLEAMMIANPTVAAFRYDPYTDILSKEFYDHQAMRACRWDAIMKTRKATCIGLILSTLGRQGSPAILKKLKGTLKQRNISCIVLLLSEITPQKLASYEDGIDAWIQVACPRLSLDWGYVFSKPILSPFEANVALGNIELPHVYPMDYYAKDSLGPWTNYHKNLKLT